MDSFAVKRDDIASRIDNATSLSRNQDIFVPLNHLPFKGGDRIKEKGNTYTGQRNPSLLVFESSVQEVSSSGLNKVGSCASKNSYNTW